MEIIISQISWLSAEGTLERESSCVKVILSIYFLDQCFQFYRTNQIQSM